MVMTGETRERHEGWTHNGDSRGMWAATRKSRRRAVHGRSTGTGAILTKHLTITSAQFLGRIALNKTVPDFRAHA